MVCDDSLDHHHALQHPDSSLRDSAVQHRESSPGALSCEGKTAQNASIRFLEVSSSVVVVHVVFPCTSVLTH